MAIGFFSVFAAARPLQESQAANISLCGTILRADRIDVGPARRSHCLPVLVVLIKQSNFDQSERSKEFPRMWQHFWGKFHSS